MTTPAAYSSNAPTPAARMDDLSKLVDGVRDAISVRRVYGDPITHEGVTIIPAAHFAGGGGGGGGEGGEDDKQGSGMGMGFGGAGRPAGAFVIKDGEVRWQPAVNPNLIAILGAGLLALVIGSVRRLLSD